MDKILETGTITKKDDAAHIERVPYKMVYLRKNDLLEIMALQSLILHRLTRPDLLQMFSYDFMAQHIDEQGFVIGVMVEDRLIAFRNAYFPMSDDREWNLGYDIGLNRKEDLEQVANLQMVCVHPQFRGNSLAMRMNAIAIEQIKRSNRYRYLCATVSPYNYWNVRILLECGFVVKALKQKYKDKLRYVVCQCFEKPLPGIGDRRSTQEGPLNIRLTDIDRQRNLIEEGFIGVRINVIPAYQPKNYQEFANGYEIVYAKGINA